MAREFNVAFEFGDYLQAEDGTIIAKPPALRATAPGHKWITVSLGAGMVDLLDATFEHVPSINAGDADVTDITAVRVVTVTGTVRQYGGQSPTSSPRQHQIIWPPYKHSPGWNQNSFVGAKVLALPTRTPVEVGSRKTRWVDVNTDGRRWEACVLFKQPYLSSIHAIPITLVGPDLDAYAAAIGAVVVSNFDHLADDIENLALQTGSTMHTHGPGAAP